MVTLKHLIEASTLVALFCFFRLLPMDIASRLGGWLARRIGPCLKAHKTAQRNLESALSDIPPEERARILRGMWDNLGRVAAEFPRIPDNTLLERIDVRGIENIPAFGKPALFFSGHLGNWELITPIAHSLHIRLALVYRRANNPYADAIVTRLRATRCSRQLPKGPSGAVGIVRAIKDGMSLGLLVDQKMNDGIPVPFFGREAMTAPAVAQFALKYDMPVIPVRVVRGKGVRFEAHIYPPLSFDKTGNNERDTLAIMTAINKKLESWIREHPEQWFWVHKRWPS